MEYYVIRTDINNELMSKDKKIIVFDNKLHADWFLKGVNAYDGKKTFPNWKIEKFKREFDSNKHLIAIEYFGEIAYIDILKDMLEDKIINEL